MKPKKTNKKTKKKQQNNPIKSKNLTLKIQIEFIFINY